MKILLLDIESSPNTAHVWGLWQQNVSINQLMESSYVLCYAAKWLGQKDVLFDSDPLLKLKSREVDLKAMENEQKRKEAQERLNLDKMKAMMNQTNEENKLDQTEELAKLRAGVSLAKQGVQQMKIRGI